MLQGLDREKQQQQKQKPFKVRWHETKKFSEPPNETKAKTWQISKDQG